MENNPDIKNHDGDNAQCPDCKALYPKAGGTSHRYLGASPECWSVFNDILAKEYQDPAYMEVHRLTVDAYALQHPGIEGLQTKQSSIVHLASLCLVLEHKKQNNYATSIIKKLSEQKKDQYPWLTPPEFIGDMTVQDIVIATSASEHKELVHKWAKIVYQCWERHHPYIRNLLADFSD